MGQKEHFDVEGERADARASKDRAPQSAAKNLEAALRIANGGHDHQTAGCLHQAASQQTQWTLIRGVLGQVAPASDQVPDEI